MAAAAAADLLLVPLFLPRRRRSPGAPLGDGEGREVILQHVVVEPACPRTRERCHTTAAPPSTTMPCRALLESVTYSTASAAALASAGTVKTTTFCHGEETQKERRKARNDCKAQK